MCKRCERVCVSRWVRIPTSTLATHWQYVCQYATPCDSTVLLRTATVRPRWDRTFLATRDPCDPATLPTVTLRGLRWALLSYLIKTSLSGHAVGNGHDYIDSSFAFSSNPPGVYNLPSVP